MTDSDTMPALTRAVYDKLWPQVEWLHANWALFCELFAGSKDTVDMLNKAAPWFFFAAQQALWEKVILRACHLTDPAHHGKSENLSLRRLVETLDPVKHASLRSDIEAILRDHDSTWERLRDHRNKLIAHADMAVYTGAVPLQQVSKNLTDDALSAIVCVMKRVEKHFGEADVQVGCFSIPGGGAALVKVVSDAAKYRDLGGSS